MFNCQIEITRENESILFINAVIEDLWICIKRIPDVRWR